VSHGETSVTVGLVESVLADRTLPPVEHDDELVADAPTRHRPAPATRPRGGDARGDAAGDVSVLDDAPHVHHAPAETPAEDEAVPRSNPHGRRTFSVASRKRSSRYQSRGLTSPTNRGERQDMYPTMRQAVSTRVTHESPADGRARTVPVRGRGPEERDR
jgi:hypothetical protein